LTNIRRIKNTPTNVKNELKPLFSIRKTVLDGEHSQPTYSKEEAWKRAKYWLSLWTHLNMKEVDEKPELRTYKHHNSSNLLRNGFICPHDYRAGSSIQIVHPKLGEKW